MRIRFAIVALLALCACPSQKKEDATSAELASQARASLAERERKLTSYRFHGLTTDMQRNESLGFKFAYRSPGKMRGETEGAQPHVIVFDGAALRDLDVNAKKLTTFDLAGLPKDRADAFLHQIFAPFAPEGFRAPLLPSANLTAEKKLGDGDKPEVQLSASVADGAQKYEFTFLFTTPAMDLLDKRIRGPEGDSRVQVTKQSCEPKSALCFPTEIVETHDGQPTARTLLSDIVVNAAIPDGDFELAVPTGGTEEKKTLATAN